MKAKNSLHKLDDIIFEKKNKLYGAYELRTQYNSRLTLSLIITMSSSLLLFIFLYNVKSKPGELVIDNSKDPVIFSDVFFFDNAVQKEIKGLVQKVKSNVKPDLNSFLTVIDSSIKQAIDTSTHQTVASTDPFSGSYSSNPFITDTISTAGNGGNKVNTYSQAVVDQSPEFPGGIGKFYKFLLKHIHYTDKARNAGLAAKLYIHFIVDEEGFIQQVELMNKVGFGLDEEVQKVLLNSPQWKPGKFKNEPVKTVMILPVSFSFAQ